MSPGHRLLLRAGLALAAVTLAVSCSPAGEPAEGQEARWPPSPAVVEVTMRDYAFDFDEPVAAGRAVFRFTNAGSVDHRASLVPLPDDLPPIDEQLRGDQRRTVPSLAGINDRPPGQTGTFAVDLVEGRRYALVSFNRGDDGELYARKGMAAEFRAGGPATPPGQGE
jgi:hypothetical protein